DGKARVEIDWLRGASRTARFSAHGAGTTRYEFHHESRSCIYVHSPSAITYHIAIPERPLLSVGVGVVSARQPINFSLRATHEGTEKTLMWRRISKAGQWFDVTIDLSDYASKTIDLRFQTGSEVSGDIALWSNPILYQGREASEGVSPDSKKEDDR
ncbi:MAG: hypothetical protein V3T03_00950, partial [Candidatus Bipolaricaulota bacterium]